MVYATVVGAALLACAGPSGVPAARVKPAELDTFSLKVDRLVFNNLLLKEETNAGLTTGPQDARGFSTLTVRGSFRNAGDEAPFNLTLVGEDAGGEVVWVCSLAGVAPAGYVDSYESRVAVLPGTLTQTAVVRVRARVGALPPQGAPASSPYPANYPANSRP